MTVLSCVVLCCVMLCCVMLERNWFFLTKKGLLEIKIIQCWLKIKAGILYTPVIYSRSHVCLQISANCHFVLFYLCFIKLSVQVNEGIVDRIKVVLKLTANLSNSSNLDEIFHLATS